jgi:Phosphotransferase enzyme family
MSSLHRSKFAPPAEDSGAVAQADVPEWLACLQEACELLWPAPALVTVETGEPGRSGLRDGWQRLARCPARPSNSEFALIHQVHRPPLLVPADRHVAAAAIRHHTRPRSPAGRLGVKALSLSLAGGLGGAVLRGRVHVSAPAGASTIESHLKEVLEQDLQLSMYLGPARANRKPVLQLLTEDGETAAFAKIGVNPLTCRLVRAEHDSLLQLGRAGLSEITIPRVLHFDSWQGLDVLVLSPLPAWLPPRPLSSARLTAAMTELAHVAGVQTGPLLGSRYLQTLRSRLVDADQGAEQAALHDALDTLAARAGDEVLTFGSWHGDWSPWNMASTSQGLLVWDWERFTCCAPLGFDALHYRLQSEVTAGQHDPAAAARQCFERAVHQLDPFGVAPRPAQVTALLYLVDLAARYLADRQAKAGAPLGAPGTWLIPAVADKVTRL